MQLKPDKALSMIGIAAKAGKVASGEFSTEKAIKCRQAYLVIVAGDASENTKKHFSDMCAYRGINYKIYADKECLGNSIGRQFRASIAVTDKNLANAVLRQFDIMEQLNNGGNK